MQINYSSKDFFNLFGHTITGIGLHMWCRLLWSQRRNIDIRFLPKLCALTAPIALNYPIQKLEAIRYNRKIKATKIKAPIFILGHYRSGTTFLHELLCLDQQFVYCSTNQALNPQTFLTTGKFTKALMKLAMPEKRPMDNMGLGVEKPMEEEFALGCLSEASLIHSFYFPKAAQSFFDRFVLFQEDEKDREHWQTNFDFFTKKISFTQPDGKILFKSPGNTGRVDEILKLYPDARFIHIHRHPYDVFQSSVRLYERLLPLHGFHRVQADDMIEYILYAYETLYKKYLVDKKNLESYQLTEIKYDQFTADPIGELARIYGELNIGYFEDSKSLMEMEIKNRSTYKTNTYKELNSDHRQQIDRRWGFMFDEYGYSHL